MKSIDPNKLTRQHLQEIRDWLEACSHTELEEAKLTEQHPGSAFEYYLVTKAQVTRIVSECILFALFCKSFVAALPERTPSKMELLVSESNTPRKHESAPL